MEKAKNVDKALEVEGNIGDKRQNECVRFFGGKLIRAMGGTTAPYHNPLVDSNWKSNGVCDSEFGPGDKISGG